MYLIKYVDNVLMHDNIPVFFHQMCVPNSFALSPKHRFKNVGCKLTLLIKIIIVLTYQSIRHLSGDVGGQIGLFLGASLLTLVEYLDLCAMVLFTKYKYRNK